MIDRQLDDLGGHDLGHGRPRYETFASELYILPR